MELMRKPEWSLTDRISDLYILINVLGLRRQFLSYESILIIFTRSDVFSLMFFTCELKLSLQSNFIHRYLGSFSYGIFFIVDVDVGLCFIKSSRSA